MAWDVPAQDYLSPTLLNQKSGMRTSLIGAYVTTELRSYPPDSARYDTRIEVMPTVLLSAQISSRFGLRFGVLGKYTDRVETESTSSSNKVTEKSVRLNGYSDLAITMENGLELAGGARAVYLPVTKEETSGVTITSTRSLSATYLIAPRVALQKKTSAWTGAFYYFLSAEKKRKFTHTANDLSVTNSEIIEAIPPSIGGLFDVPWGGSRLVVEAALVQAGELSAKSEDGIKVNRDYYKVLGSYSTQLSFCNWQLSANHKTLSYAEQGFMTIENIPLTQVESTCEFGSESSRTIFGAGLVYGKDGQSLEQFNADFTVINYMAQFGYHSTF